MRKVEELKEPPFIGKYYLVKCVEFKGLWVPVIGKKHLDKNLNIDYEHYHVDGRFFYKKLKSLFNSHKNNDGDFKVIDTMFLLEKPTYKKLKCNFSIQKQKENRFENDPCFKDFRKKFKRKKLKMKNMICPHQGYDLSNTEVVEDTVICPMHCLKFNAITGEQI